MAPTLKGRRRSPLPFVWGAFALLAVAALLFRGASPPPPQTEAPARLSPAPLGEIGAVEVVAAGAWYRFERGADGLWFRHVHAGPGGGEEGGEGHRHLRDPATAETVARALSAFLETPVVEASPGGDAESLGIDAPRLFVVLYRRGEDKPLARYPIGRETPDGRSRYVGVAGAGTVLEAGGDGISALLALLDDGGG